MQDRPAYNISLKTIQMTCRTSVWSVEQHACISGSWSGQMIEVIDDLAPDTAAGTHRRGEIKNPWNDSRTSDQAARGPAVCDRCLSMRPEFAEPWRCGSCCLPLAIRWSREEKQKRVYFCRWTITTAQWRRQYIQRLLSAIRFHRHSASASAERDIVIPLSSVCPSRCGVESKRMYRQTFFNV